MSNRKNLEEFAAKIYEKTGVRLDVEESLYNLRIAAACEAQRINSSFPEVPVISEVEISDRSVFDGKLNNFGTDIFFFLKEQENSFDEKPYPSSFYEEEEGHINIMLSRGMKKILTDNADLFVNIINTASSGERVRARLHIDEPTVSGKVAFVDTNGNPGIEASDEYVMVLEIHPDDEEKPIQLVDAYPI